MGSQTTKCQWSHSHYTIELEMIFSVFGRQIESLYYYTSTNPSPFVANQRLTNWLLFNFIFFSKRKINCLCLEIKLNVFCVYICYTYWLEFQSKEKGIWSLERASVGIVYWLEIYRIYALLTHYITNQHRSLHLARYFWKPNARERERERIFAKILNLYSTQHMHLLIPSFFSEKLN